MLFKFPAFAVVMPFWSALVFSPTFMAAQNRENPEGRYTLAFLGYGPEESNTVFELTYNWDRKEPYDKGGGYAQMAISTKVGGWEYTFA